MKSSRRLNQDYEVIVSTSKHKKYSKNHSTVNPPLFRENENVFVIERCVIPELHVLQAFFNHIFWERIVKTVGRESTFVAEKVEADSKKISWRYL